MQCCNTVSLGAELIAEYISIMPEVWLCMMMCSEFRLKISPAANEKAEGEVRLGDRCPIKH